MALDDNMKSYFKSTASILEDLENRTTLLTDKSKRLSGMQEQYADTQRLINELLEHSSELGAEEVALYNNLSAKRIALIKTIRDEKAELEKINKQEEKRKKILDKVWSVTKDTFKYLMDQDRIIRTTIISLGMSGQKAELIRQSFENSAATVYALGGNLEDVLKIMTGFADETGRARALSVQTIKAIEQIGKGTNLGVEAATLLGGQFEMIGIDAVTANKKVQSIVDTSERMGLNTTKILKSVNDNFKKAQTFTFKGGVTAMADMAINAEKTRLSMSKTFDIAEASRNLEHVIELGANLQIMGGEFSKMDPLQWLYTARNEPEKLNEQISLMSKGLYTLKKDSEGVFSAAITPADADRMRFIAKQLNMTTEEFAEIAKKRLLLDKMEFTFKGLGFTEEQKQWVAGVAELNTKTGQYQVKVNDTLVNIKDLTKQQANSFIQEQSTLQQRAQENITFSEQWLLMISQLKSTLLPLLRVFNGILKPLTQFSKWYGSLFEDNKGGWARGIVIGLGLITTSFILLKKSMLWMSTIGGNLTKTIFGGLSKTRIPAGGVGGPNAAQTLATGKAGMYSGKGRLLSGLGTAAAAIGIGTGIMLAAKGISQLADAMSKLSDEKAKTLGWIAGIMSVTFPSAAVGLTAVAKSAKFSAEGLAVLSTTFLAIGGAIGIAAAGIGVAATGISKLATAMSLLSDEKAKSLQRIITSMAIGLPAAAIGVSIFGKTLANPTTATGLGIFSIAMLSIGASIGIAALGVAKLATAMSKLTNKQAESLQKIATTMAIMFPLAAIGVTAFGAALANPATVTGLGVLSLAMLSIGTSIGIATLGFSKLTTAMSSLPTDKANTLQKIATTMAITFPLAAIGLIALAKGATFSADGLSILSGTLLAVGAAIGLAATGIGIAANGISKLATAMSSLTNEKAKSLQKIATTMAITFPLAAVGLIALAKGATFSADGLGILSISFLAIGGSIWLASKGIAKMMESLSKLTTTSKGSGLELFNIAGGIAAINTALALTGPMGFIGGMLGGFTALKKTINTITAKATELKMVGDSFKNIAAVLSGNENDYKEIINLINSISKLNVAKKGAFSELAEIMKKPLKVEFDNNKVQLYNDISLNIDGEKVFKSTYTVQRALSKHVRAYHQGMDK